VNDKLAAKANTTDVYDKSEVYMKSEVDNKLVAKANVADVYSKAQTYSRGDTYTQSQVDSALAGKAAKYRCRICIITEYTENLNIMPYCSAYRYFEETQNYPILSTRVQSDGGVAIHLDCKP